MNTIINFLSLAVFIILVDIRITKIKYVGSKLVLREKTNSNQAHDI